MRCTWTGRINLKIFLRYNVIKFWKDVFGYFNALETHSDTTLPFRDVAKLAFIHNSVIAVVVTRVMLNMEKFAADFVYSNETVMKQGTVFILEQ